MPDDLEHLELERHEDTTPRRRGGGRGSQVDDPRGHASQLLSELQHALEAASKDEAGFDDRRLLRLVVDGAIPELGVIPGVEVVSEEQKDGKGRRVALVFSTQQARAEFERRLSLMQRGRQVTRADVLYAIRGIDAWTPADRTAPALARVIDEWSSDEAAVRRLDVEFFPFEDAGVSAREEMIRIFTARAAARGVRVLDKVTQAVVLLRVETAMEGLRWLLRYRDVRIVDRPPLFQLPPELQRIALEALDFRDVPADAPLVAVLDSGILTGHPLLGPVVADAQSFIPGLGPEDEHGHGTAVAGIAAYGDVEDRASRRQFSAAVRVVSGRVLDRANEYDGLLIEHQLRDAVAEFVAHGCRVFNLSLADVHHPYDGGRMRPLAATIDALVREHDLVFTVATGNFLGSATVPSDWRNDYPSYLLDDAARILDPAPALNAIAVGGVARHDQSRLAARNRNDPAYQPVARRDEPSPFTRAGPGLNGAVKPELVEHAGNWVVDLRASSTRPGGDRDVGVLSLNKDFIAGNLFTVDAGTSYAAPRIANLAARVRAQFPDASANLVRALLVAHAEQPSASVGRIADPDDRLRVIGYGIPDEGRTLASNERSVTLYREDEIEENSTHFYELPLPPDFTGGTSRRERRIRVAIAHAPIVRTTRLEYRASRFCLRIVKAATIAEVKRVFRQTSRDEREAAIKEPSGIFPGPATRFKGTVQLATWTIRQIDSRWKPPFIVVERVVPEWAETRAPRERYAIVVVLEERGTADVRYHTQLRERLRQRVRVRPRR